MKKVLVVVLVSVLTMGSAFAQKGTWYLGTSAMTSQKASFVTGFMFDKYDEAQTLTLGIAPDAGYFVADKFSIGLGLAFNLTSDKIDSDADAVNTIAIGFNPYARYFMISKGNFGFYLQGGFSFVTSMVDIDGVDPVNTFYIGINPGISYSLGKHFGLTAAFGNLGYTSYNKDHDNFGLNVDMSSLKFGLSWLF